MPASGYPYQCQSVADRSVREWLILLLQVCTIRARCRSCVDGSARMRTVLITSIGCGGLMGSFVPTVVECHSGLLRPGRCIVAVTAVDARR
jgi:hypothetical protein